MPGQLADTLLNRWLVILLGDRVAIGLAFHSHSHIYVDLPVSWKPPSPFLSQCTTTESQGFPIQLLN